MGAVRWDMGANFRIDKWIKSTLISKYDKYNTSGR